MLQVVDRTAIIAHYFPQLKGFVIMVKDKYVTMRVDEETQDYLKEMAARDRRSVANLLSLIIGDAVAADKVQENNQIAHDLKTRGRVV